MRMVEYSVNGGYNDNHEVDDEPTPIEVLDIISRCAEGGSSFLDLSQRVLKCIPRELLNLEHIQFLYLEGNQIQMLPSDFFERLPHLRWLDLRNNQLRAIPSAFVGQHTNLQTLLLGGNQLRTLPLELGLVSTLSALNLAENPLEFPPDHVVAGGVQEIVTFLRRMLLAKSGREPTADLNRMSRMAATETETSNDTSAGGGSYSSSAVSRPENGSSLRTGLSSADEASVARLTRTLSNQDLLTQQPVEISDSVNSHSATLHKPVAYYQIRQQYLERVRKGSSQNPMVAKKQSDKHNRFVNKFPEPPPMDAIERRILEEKRKQRMKDVKLKQDAILQRRRDQESVKQWREESRARQRARFMQQMRRERSEIQAESKARLEAGPFDVDAANLGVKSKGEWHRDQWRNIEPDERPRPLSPATLEAREAERAHRERELEARVRDHTKGVLERRRQAGTKVTAQEEIEAARRDMQILQIMRRTLLSAKGRIEFWN